VVTGLWFSFESHRLYNEAKRGIPKNPMKLFHLSITHLTLLFLAVAIDPLLFIAL
jgi:protoheme IX farnesyltransferase